MQKKKKTNIKILKVVIHLAFTETSLANLMENKFIALVRVIAAAVLMAGIAQLFVKKVIIGSLVIAAGILLWVYARKVVEHLGMGGD